LAESQKPKPKPKPNRPAFPPRQAVDAGFRRKSAATNTFADALDFRGMQGVKLVLVVDLLRADAFGALDQRL
jgi:hypothetical protein